jgi:hypothetical protein
MSGSCHSIKGLVLPARSNKNWSTSSCIYISACFEQRRDMYKRYGRTQSIGSDSLNIAFKGSAEVESESTIYSGRFWGEGFESVEI